MRLSLLVSLVTLSAIASSVQVASAQETRGARFNFAPNTYKTESSRVPKGYGAPDPEHNVRAGSVPTNNHFGLDPSFLAKPAPPPQIIAARPAAIPMPTVSARAFVPQSNANFHPSFGRPMVAQAQQLPASVPQQAVAMPIPQQVHPAMAAPARVARRHVNTGVNARLMTKIPRRTINPASATPAVASYGKGVGYTPGAYLPSASGGMSTQTEVNAKLYHRR